LGLRRLARAPLIASFDAPLATRFAPLHAGSLRVGFDGRNGEAQGGSDPKKGKHSSTRGRFTFDVFDHVQSPDLVTDDTCDRASSRPGSIEFWRCDPRLSSDRRRRSQV